MSRILKYHKTITIMLVVTFLSLMKTSDITPRDIFQLPYFDKIVHFLMYFTMTFFFMFEYYLQHKHRITHIVQILIIPLFWGASMELAQLFFTDYRGADWWDMLANSIGVFTAYFVVCIFRHNKLIGYLILFPFNKREVTI
nr:VanZ family protein [uncultured Carboxylicivirga sp.]